MVEVEVLVLGQCGDFMQKLSTSSEALERFPVSHVLVSNGVVNITTLPSFRQSIGKVLIRGNVHQVVSSSPGAHIKFSIVSQHQDGHMSVYFM